ncbi:cytochrome P450 [Dactylosporangium fulvum]|uniref:Cytochrome P450 n=1 Tax=Dactylosporangium fulvum TaxID=53359 RepID=A0ABY5W9T9_9ACTN|nr:cytochrome P450 [Dactylosporangium fulvum]UWP85984.1 cytochrome P450 [Dactylosporangium fulvum]
MAAASVFSQILDHANRADPYPLYAQLRRTPVSRADDGTYVVSTYREIVALLHDPRVSSDPRHRAEPGGPPTEPGDGVSGLPSSFIALDPPEHDRVRRLLTRHFGPPHNPRRIAGMVPELVAVVTDLIDGFAGRDRVDIVDDFAYPFPVTVICRVLGVPREDEPRFHAWAAAVVDTVDPTTGDFAERFDRRRQVFAELGRYLAGLAEAHRRHPGDGMLSGLVTDDDPDGRLSLEEIMSNAALLLIAGHETTVNLIANGVLTLLRHPGCLDRLRHRPDFSVPVVEELLRYEPPVQFLTSRVALDDIDLDGTTVPRGASITLVLAAGSRDPDHVTDPDRFDPDREHLEHLGFGGGVHYCFGAPLARLEAQVALAELARRLERPRLLDDPPPYRTNPVLRGPRHLPVAFDGLVPAAEPVR